MKTFNTVGKLGCVRACRKGYFPAQGDYAGVRPGWRHYRLIPESRLLFTSFNRLAYI